MLVLHFARVHIEDNLGIIPGDWEDGVLDCHEACSDDFDRCWDDCGSDDEECHNRCVAESDDCDTLCEDGDDWDLDDDFEEGGSDWYVNYETCSIACDDRFDACFDACDGDEQCEEECEDLAVECDTACIEAEDNWEEWSQEDWDDLEEELKQK